MAKEMKLKQTGRNPAQDYIEKLTLSNLKRECLVRGMPFEDLVNSSVPNLQSWFLKNYPNPIHRERLNEFDDWNDKILRARNVDSTMLDPIFRLGSIASRDGEGNILKKKRVTGMIKKDRKRREKTKAGLFTGTKKAYTFELQSQGKTKSEVITLVMEKFSDAKEKSISIWFNKSKKVKK
jgi:hypothetical protein